MAEHINIRSVLDKMEHSDSDFRYMAANDLSIALTRKSELPFRVDHDTQKKLCKGIIKLLTDSNNEVISQAMKCVPPLACTVSDQHALLLFDHLMEALINRVKQFSAKSAKSNKDLGNVAFLGLREILVALPANSTKSITIAKTNIPRILTAIESTDKPADADIEPLQLLNALLSCNCPETHKFHDRARKTIFQKLAASNTLVRKRAVVCIGSLGQICDDAIFKDILNVTIADLRRGGASSSAGISAVWALSRTSGRRLGPYLEVLVPIFFGFCNSTALEDDDSLREQCLQVLQTFCNQCRFEITPFVDDLTKIAISLSKYDPNYAYDESDDEDNGESVEMTDAEGEDDEDDFLDYEDDGEESDDGDESWKVRRGAIRCINAIISGQLLASDVLYSTFGLFLVSRFKEREGNVKLDVFDAFIALLRIRTATATVASSPTASQSLDTFSAQIVLDMDIGNSRDLAPLHDRALVIVRSLRKELGGRTEATRVKVMSVLLEFVKAAPQSLAPHFGLLVEEVERGLSDESANLKTETLLFLKGVAATGAPPMKDHIAKLVEKILKTAEDRYFKITAESLRLCERLITTFGTASASDCRNAMSPLAPKIYDAAEKRITAADHDSEVKEAALVCIGPTVSYFGDYLGEERLAKVGTILCGRLKNEVTRLASVRAMLKIAKSNKGNVFLPVAEIVTSTVVSFLRKNAPALRAASLELLSTVPALAPESDATLLANVSELITDVDLKMSHLALCVLASLIRARGASICEQIATDGGAYAKALKLAVSPVLQGRAVEALLDALNCLAKVNAAPLTAERMVRDLHELVKGIDAVGTAAIRSPAFSLAKCVVVVCAGATAPFRSSVLAGLVSSTKSSDPKTGVFSLACLGEFGKRGLLTDPTEQAQVQQTILEVLDSPIMEVKAAAAVSLGGLASANGETGLTALLHLINERPALRYLLLLALKDAIMFSAKDDVLKTMPLMLPMLWNSVPMSPAGNAGSPTVSDAESRRVVIAECLALLALASPKSVVPTLREAVGSESTDIRGVVFACLRCAFSANTSGASAAEPLAAELEPILLEFVGHIDDVDVGVSQNTLQAVNAIARTRPAVLAESIGRILPLVYKRTHKNPELVRTINLGPFQHEEDYGLDLRKMAFALMRTLITGPLARLVPISTFLENVVIGLGDQADVRAMAQLILGAVTLSPYAVHIVEMLTPVVRALTKTLGERLKENAVRQEAERYADSIRGALRATRMLQNVAEIAGSPTFKNLMEGTVQRQFAEKYNKIVQEMDMMNAAPGAGPSPRMGGTDLMRD